MRLSEMAATISKRSGNAMEKICSNRQIFINNDVEIARERLREIMNSYKDDEDFNFDETSFAPEFSGRDSIHSPILPIYTPKTKRKY